MHSLATDLFFRGKQRKKIFSDGCLLKGNKSIKENTDVKKVDPPNYANFNDWYKPVYLCAVRAKVWDQCKRFRPNTEAPHCQ